MEIKKLKSKLMQIMCGVSQGSILGQIFWGLFIIFLMSLHMSNIYFMLMILVFYVQVIIKKNYVVL